jgi:hypothetical protein
MPLKKEQKQLILLGVLLAAIVGVLAWYLLRPTVTTMETYASKEVRTDIPSAVLEHPEYRKLSLPVELPLTAPAKKGRQNPFEPY